MKLAESLPGPSAPRRATAPRAAVGFLLSPSQVNFVGQPGTPQSQQLSVTNSGRSTERVQLSTRALTREVSDSGVQTFTMDPSSLTANSGTMPIWCGVTEVFQTETFNVPRTDPQDAVAAAVLGRLPVHRPGFPATRGVVRTGRYVRQVHQPAGSGRLRPDGSDQPAAGALDGASSLPSWTGPPPELSVPAAPSSGTPKPGSTRPPARSHRRSWPSRPAKRRRPPSA